MTTQTTIISEGSATDLRTALTPNPVNDAFYTLENVGANAVIIAEASSAPSDDFAGHRVGIGQRIEISFASGTSIYARCVDGRSSTLAVTESA